MNQESARREIAQLVNRIDNLTKYIISVNTLDNTWMQNQNGPAGLQLRMNMFRVANDYIKEEWEEIKKRMEEIFAIWYKHKSYFY